MPLSLLCTISLFSLPFLFLLFLLSFLFWLLLLQLHMKFEYNSPSLPRLRLYFVVSCLIHQVYLVSPFYLFLDCCSFLFVCFPDFFSLALFCFSLLLIFFSFVCSDFLQKLFFWIRELVTFSSLFSLSSSVAFNTLFIQSASFVIALMAVANVWIVGDALISVISGFV